MTQSRVAYVALGSNLGDRRQFLEQAIEALGQIEEVQVLRHSRWLQTEPLGCPDYPPYLNGVAELATSLEAHQLLDHLQRIEQDLGRERSNRWAPRTLDLDLLFLDRVCIDSSRLVVPHSQMHLRSFVLEPLAELNPKLIHPVLQCSVEQLLTRLKGRDWVLDPVSPRLVAIAGNIGAGKSTLARRLHERLGGELLPEPYSTNPFLARVYEGQHELALDAQLYFLIKRSEQLGVGRCHSGRFYWADYWFKKELIFARRLLDREQLDLYEPIYHSFIEKVTLPAVVIYLQGSVDLCLSRIKQRSRDYEQHITPEFLAGLAQDYDLILADWRDSPVIRLDIPAFDSLSDRDCDWLVQQIKAYVEPDERTRTEPWK